MTPHSPLEKFPNTVYTHGMDLGNVSSQGTRPQNLTYHLHVNLPV